MSLHQTFWESDKKYSCLNKEGFFCVVICRTVLDEGFGNFSRVQLLAVALSPCDSIALQ